MTPPATAKHLRQAVERAASRLTVAPLRLQHTVASTVVLQMVPNGVVKGGASVRQRVSEQEARLTNDLDFARPHGVSVDDFVDEFADSLEQGWGGFTGVLKKGRKASPQGVPGEYVMEPFRLSLRYRGKPYCTVVFELGHSEVGSADDAAERLGPDVPAIFEEIGLPVPQPVRLMSAEHQIVQKIHACTSVTADGSVNARAHDLVDIQILCAIEDVDFETIGRIGPLLFSYRQQHAWPPTVVVHPGWDSLYQGALEGLLGLARESVHPDVSSAASEVNEIVRRASNT